MIWLAAVCGGICAAFGQVAAQPAQEQVAPRPAQEMVLDVRIVGNKSLPLEKIQPHIRTRPGRPFDLELIEEDVRRLDNSHMFVNVKTYSQQVNGGRIVIFELLERPQLKEVLFVGCSEIRKKVLQKEADLKVGDAMDPFAIEEARRKLEDFYHKRGFSGARIALLEGDKPEDRRAVFLINEGVKQKVFWTGFVGNTIASDARLRTQIKSGPPFLWLFKGELDRKQIDEDVERLTAYYRGLGFFRARIGRELEFNEKENWVSITFVIDEGPRYKIRNVSVVGNTKFAGEELLTALKLARDDYFNQSKMTADVNVLQDKYGGIGYVFADVKADPRFLEEPAQLDLVYNIKEGDRYRVGKINVDIKGEYPHTQLTTVLNRLSLRPGDIVDIREIRASERRLRACGLFESNPATGNAPKIVFSPPDQENDENPESGTKKPEVARRPKRGTGTPGAGFRGQSPDPQPRTAWYPPSTGAQPSQDRELTVTLDCGRYVGPQEPVESRERRVESEERKVEGGRSTPIPALRHLCGAGVSPASCTTTSWAAETAAPQISPNMAESPNPQVPNPNLIQTLTELTGALSRESRQRQAPSRLILTQYTPDAGQSTPSIQRPPLHWTGAAVAPAGTSGVPASGTYDAPPAYAAPQPALPQPAPVQPAPPYGQMIRPRSGPERPIDSPAGPYYPGPIFSEGSPFNDGPPDGGESARPLPFGVTAEETMTGRLMFGVGINSDAGLVGQIVIDEQNFDWTRFPRSWEDIRNATAWRGAGQRMRIEAVPGTQVQRYMINFQEPYLFNTPVSMGLSGYYYNRIYSEYTDQRVGGRTALGYQFAPDLSGSIAYRGAKINITNPIAPLLPDLAEVSNRDLALHGFQLALTHDKRDNAFLATEGHLIEMSVEQVLGSFQYPRSEVDLRKYFTLYERPDGSGRHVLSLAAHGGWTGDNTPIYERFYAGGFSTIRGFQFRGASPRKFDPNSGQTVLVGGDFELLGSIEYLFPITADDMLRAVVFCDTGTVEPSIDQWNDKYRIAPGFGLRIVVPAMGPAPIALDFAFPIAWQPGDQHEMFSFFVGFGR
jgi:outer membrane protein insertion porin family